MEKCLHRIVKVILFTWIIFYVGLSYANTFNFKTIGSLPTSVQSRQTVTAIYNVSSVGTFPPGKYHIIYALLSNPSNVSQDLTIANACGISPINPTGCNLKLNITGPVSGPIKVCDDWNRGPGLNCYIPANSNDYLNVQAAKPPYLTVTPSTAFLGPSISQTFTVFNTSTRTTAINVTITIPANVQRELLGAPVYRGTAPILVKRGQIFF